MKSIADLCAEGLAHHRAGRLGEAEVIYRQVLSAEPGVPEVWYLLGVLANQVGKHEAAIPCLEHAIGLNANLAEAHCALGTAFEGLGRPEQAVASYRLAIGLKAQYPEAHFNLANVLREHGQLQQAIAHYRQAVELRPDFVDALTNLGLALKRAKLPVEAEPCLRRVVELNPNWADAHHNLGLVLNDQGKLDDAILCFRQALALNSSLAEVHNSLAAALRDQEQFVDAERECRQALALRPDFAAAHINMGLILQAQRKLKEAMESFQGVMALSPDAAETRKILRTVDSAAGDSQRAQAHCGIASLRLASGEFEQGWKEYEWRWHVLSSAPPDRGQPLWEGEGLQGRTILLWAEQGLGDTIQFIRYAPLVKAQGATVVVECMKPLVKLLARSPGIDRLIGRDDELPAFDVHAPLLSLPRIFQTRVETIPVEVPYLFADATLIVQPREQLRGLSGLRVGINWAGRTTPGFHKRRDVPLDHFVRLAEVPGLSLISLQKGEGREELMRMVGEAQATIVDLGDEVDTANGAFMDTAAIIMNLDLVITSDTAIAHLAGALGAPVWVALPFVPDWRWMLDRSDSPWYPTMRLFRQKRNGDWTGAFHEIRGALEEVVAGRSGLRELREVKELPRR